MNERGTNWPDQTRWGETKRRYSGRRSPRRGRGTSTTTQRPNSGKRLPNSGGRAVDSTKKVGEVEFRGGDRWDRQFGHHERLLNSRTPPVTDLPLPVHKPHMPSSVNGRGWSLPLKGSRSRSYVWVWPSRAVVLVGWNLAWAYTCRPKSNHQSAKQKCKTMNNLNSLLCTLSVLSLSLLLKKNKRCFHRPSKKPDEKNQICPIQKNRTKKNWVEKKTKVIR